MPETSSNTSRIAKNTLLLYFRMLLTMGVTLYTSRVILNALGVEDYGIYNVVGGVVAMFGILSGSLSAAISRFITFELGKGDFEKLKKIFCTSVNIQVMLIALITVLMESVGIWFLNAKMVIPPERLQAANWVFQFSVVTFALNLLSVPYNAVIIAHEKMSAFAYISIIDCTLKLIVAFIIAYNPFDKLVYYGLLIMIVGAIIRSIYAIYCKRHFEEATYKMIFDKGLMKEMFGFAGWNFIGSSAVILRDQGGNMILNLFFGPFVNASRGIAVQVNHVLHSFVNSFMTALNPQITKSYAQGDNAYMMKLIFLGSRFSFFLLLFLSLPLFFSTHFVLELWLKQVPDYSVIFVQLVMVLTLHESLANPLITAMLATGNIKKYQIIAGGLNSLNFPVSYLLLRNGYSPEFVFITAIVFSFVIQVARLWLLSGMIKLNVLKYLKEVYLNVISVTVVAIIIPFALCFRFEEGVPKFLILSVTAAVCTLVAVFFIGCKKEERVFALNKVKGIIGKHK